MVFEDLIKDRSVLLIGPASYLLDTPIAEKTLNYDTVIRVNSGVDLVEKIPEYVGKRTDVLFTTCDRDPSNDTNNRKVDSWIKNNVGHVRISPPGIRQHFQSNIEMFIRENRDRLNFSIIDKQQYIDQISLCGDSIPNTGFSAIMDCLFHNPKKIHISGITFFKGGYLKDYEGRAKTEQEVRSFFSRVSSHHNIDKQIIAFKKIFASNENLSCDSYIMEVLGL
jgi:hypothetical protein